MNFIRKYQKSMFVIVILILITGLIFLNNISEETASSELVNLSEETESYLFSEEDPIKEKQETSNEEAMLVIDLKGAIKRPGVYEMPIGTRVHQLIDKAGGLTSEADELAINLAASLEDGMIVYIPKIGEIEQPNMLTDALSNEGSPGKVNINNATSEELQTLTGIGPSKADAIIAYREENGSFTSPEGLLEVSGIGEKSFEKIKDEITIK